jgi:hypothetical protein
MRVPHARPDDALMRVFLRAQLVDKELWHKEKLDALVKVRPWAPSMHRVPVSYYIYIYI